MRVIMKLCKYFRATTTSVQRVSCRCKRAPSELFFDLSRPRQPPLDSLLSAASHNSSSGEGCPLQSAFSNTPVPTVPMLPVTVRLCGQFHRGSLASGDVRQELQPRTVHRLRVGPAPAGKDVATRPVQPQTSRRIYYPVSWLRRPLVGIVMQAVPRCFNVGTASTSVGLPSLADRALG